MRRLTQVPNRSTPHVFVGPIVSGNKIVESNISGLSMFLQSTYNDALALEMEGQGFLSAINANQQAESLIVRGVSDILGQKSKIDSDSILLASEHASAFAFEVLGKLDIRDEQTE